MPNHQDLLESNDAVAYLAQKWGIDKYTTGAFRVYRYRLAKERNMHFEPTLSSSTSAWWDKETLDRIPKPDRNRPRKKQQRQNEDSTGGQEPSIGGVYVFHPYANTAVAL